MQHLKKERIAKGEGIESHMAAPKKEGVRLTDT
jgi:hypothetical protein